MSDDLSELEDIARKATQGDWAWESDTDSKGLTTFTLFSNRHKELEHAGHFHTYMHGLNLGYMSSLDSNGRQNLEHIAMASPSRVLQLIEELRELRAENTQLRNYKGVA